MAGIPGQIISELGELGKQVGQEAAKVPKDIMGQALEVLSSSAKATGAQHSSANQSESSGNPEELTAWEKIDTAKDKKAKQSIARAALEALLTRPRKTRELSVWERIQLEAEEKKKQTAQKNAAQTPVTTASKRPRGDLYGVKAKRSAAEMSRNVRQD